MYIVQIHEEDDDKTNVKHNTIKYMQHFIKCKTVKMKMSQKYCTTSTLMLTTKL